MIRFEITKTGLSQTERETSQASGIICYTKRDLLFVLRMITHTRYIYTERIYIYIYMLTVNIVTIRLTPPTRGVKHKKNNSGPSPLGISDGVSRNPRCVDAGQPPLPRPTVEPVGAGASRRRRHKSAPSAFFINNKYNAQVFGY